MNDARNKNNRSNASVLFFFNGQALFIGQGTDAAPHTHHVLQITIGLKENFRICRDDEWISARYAITGPDTSHRLEGPDSGQAILLLDPENRVTENIKDKFLGTTSMAFPEFESVRPFAGELNRLSGKPSCQTARAAMEGILSALVPDLKPSPGRDPRIMKVRAYLKTLEEKKIPLSELSDFIGLSESRLVHLFKSETGIPIRRYLLWLRLMEALTLILENVSFTTAAHDAGFSDSAHLSRTFKQMFGIPPKQILKNSQFVQAISCPEQYPDCKPFN
ncbi:MAG: AraC family transcriptional regulator [Desulfobacterales bacterium]|nr:AraC family transcriptional regulator [Desulfobacterales bacterium]